MKEKITRSDTVKVNIPLLDITGDVNLKGDAVFNGEIKLNSVTVGTGAFTTTGATVDITIAGAKTTDIYFISGEFLAGVDQQDVLQWTAGDGKLTVTRLASGESGAKFSWLRIVQ